ncbi:DsrE family protein [Desulfogranum japonicum]|uniref:DsrE family protein n=1 Tax=Desulfogranum japonicum TaxID=231447 RepID=UPI00040DD4AB|nr:DsrE family protein [Desulfogranum japonicum]
MMTSIIYKAVFHIDLDEEKRLGIALANVTNLLKAVKGKPYDLVILVNGPAVTLLAEEDRVSHKETIKALQKESVAFKVCNNALTKFNIAPQNIVDGFEVVPAGIVELIELQREGYAYIKP